MIRPFPLCGVKVLHPTPLIYRNSTTASHGDLQKQKQKQEKTVPGLSSSRRKLARFIASLPTNVCPTYIFYTVQHMPSIIYIHKGGPVQRGARTRTSHLYRCHKAANAVPWVPRVKSPQGKIISGLKTLSRTALRLHCITVLTQS